MELMEMTEMTAMLLRRMPRMELMEMMRMELILVMMLRSDSWPLDRAQTRYNYFCPFILSIFLALASYLLLNYDLNFDTEIFDLL